MKLIIDIPEEAKQAFDCAESNDLKGSYYDHGGVIGNAIKNGTPLDDVKAEIEKQIERDFAFSETETLKVPCHYGIANGLQNAIRFLDNIGSEVKPNDFQGTAELHTHDKHVKAISLECSRSN